MSAIAVVAAANAAVAASNAARVSNSASVCIADNMPWYIEWLFVAGMVGIVLCIFAMFISLLRD